MIPPLVQVNRVGVRNGVGEDGVRPVPEETPIAIVHDGATHAVMMATPADLEDFALGFSLTEGVIADPAEVRGLDVVESELGVELRLWLEPGRGARMAERRRTMAGPTGCGLCGVDSLALAHRAPARPPAEIAPLGVEDILAAMAAIEPAQTLGARTRAVHAAGLWRRGEGLLALREDVGRHNALDKLAGALARDRLEAVDVVVLTSRVSVEMVQKAAVIGAPVVAAVSAPTALAVRTAEAAGITLVAVARADGFEVFTHARRILI